MHGNVDSNAASASCLKYYENHEFQFQDHSNVEDMIHDASKQYYQNSKGLRGILEDGTRPWYLGTKRMIAFSFEKRMPI